MIFSISSTEFFAALLALKSAPIYIASAPQLIAASAQLISLAGAKSSNFCIN